MGSENRHQNIKKSSLKAIVLPSEGRRAISQSATKGTRDIAEALPKANI